MLGRVLEGLVPRARPARAKVVAMKYGMPEERPQVATIEVIMLCDDTGYPDGFTRMAYAKGRRYHLPEDLARAFFQTGAADPAEAHRMADLENKRLTTEGLDKGATVTHSEAVEPATESTDEAAGRAGEDDKPAGEDRPERRPRRPRRVHG